MKKIGLCLIVKNESHVILRCLDSVKNLIDYVLVSDTGSTDGTQDVIRNWIIDNSIPGEVIQNEWIDFSHNRTMALSKLRELDHIDYALMIDADEVLVFDEGFDPIKFKSELVHDIYNVSTVLGGIIYPRPQLTSNKKSLRYEGVVHEFLAMEGTSGLATGFKNHPLQDSERNKSGPEKYRKDAALLENALLDPELNEYMRSRYTFYLAQSYRDCGEIDLAIKNYKIRSSQGFWREEEFVSLYSIAKIKNDSSTPKEEVLQDFYKSFEHSPHRVEPLYWIMQICRLHGWNQQGYMVGKIALNKLNPYMDGLFIEKWIYDYGILDEFSICSFYSGHGEESKEICLRLLSENKMPDFYIPRIQNNLNFCG